MAATDGHRMHVAEGIQSFDDETLIDAQSAIAIRDSVKASDADWVMARKWKNTLEISIEGPLLDVLLTAKAVEGTFPPYQQIIKGHEHSYELDAAMLRESLQTAMKVIRAKADKNGSHDVELRANGDLRVSTPVGFREVLELTRGAKPEHHAGVNPLYLVDAIRGADGPVRIGYGDDELDAIEITPKQGRLAVVMPVRI